MVGYFGNGILFFRLGEVLKAYAISQGRKIKPSESFGLIMLERLVDAVSIFSSNCNFAFLPMGDRVIRYWIIAFVVVTLSFIVILISFNFLNWKILVNQLGFLKEPTGETSLVL